jgi:hypothetical protein
LTTRTYFWYQQHIESKLGLQPSLSLSISLSHRGPSWDTQTQKFIEIRFRALKPAILTVSYFCSAFFILLLPKALFFWMNTEGVAWARHWLLKLQFAFHSEIIVSVPNKLLGFFFVNQFFFFVWWFCIRKSCVLCSF